MFGGRRGELQRIYHGADEAFLTDCVLGADDYAFAAKELAIRAEWPQAIAHIESLARPFAENGLPVLRIEDRWWRKLAYSSAAAREIDALKPLNPESQAQRWQNFEHLWSVDPVAVVKASSFGAFQIMGFNHAHAGFQDPLLFKEAMGFGAGAQTMAFVRLVKASPKLHAALKAGDPVAIAIHYNGSGYAANRYDVKLRQLVAKLQRGEAGLA